MQITKYVLPVVVGAMAGIMLISGGETMVFSVYPLLPGTDRYDAESLAKAMKVLPASAFMFLIVNYIVCSFLAGILTTLVSKGTTLRPPIVVGIVLTLAGLYNIVKLPHPLWFSILNLFIYLPFVYFGYLVVRKKEPVFSNNE